MLLPDVNVFVYAHRESAPRHEEHLAWLRQALAGPEPLGVSELVLSGFVRVATHPRVFDPPSTPQEALTFAGQVLRAASTTRLRPGPRHWQLFQELVERASATGNRVPDAYHAALAVESGSTLITNDRGFGRFPGLRWREPLEPP